MYTIIIFIIILLVWIFLLFKFRKKKNIISSSKITFLNKQLQTVILNWSYKEQIIDIDKLYHKALIEWWYNWTFWEILKLEPKEILNLNKIWDLHKLRNKLVHDFDTLSETVLKNKSVEYKNEFNKLIKEFK